MSFAVEFEQVSKKFVLAHESAQRRTSSLRSRLGLGGEWKELFWGVQDVSFAIKPGEVVGLIGTNGSGKSTILKLAVKILRPTSGRVSTTGRLAALLELGAGFHPDLSGRDNVYLNGSILGITHKEMGKLYDDIVAFAELERFMDSPVRHYSSGMFMRLAFSIGVHVRPEVLLIDESLAVGDKAFQTKCLTRIRDMRAQGTTIMFVSHDLESVRDLCTRAIWMVDGRIEMDGAVNPVIDAYLEAVLRKERETSGHASAAPAERWGSGEIEISGVRFLDGDGQERRDFRTGQPFIARIAYRAHRPVEGPVFGCAIYRADGVHVNGPNTALSDQQIAAVCEGMGTVDYHVSALPLLPGNYFFSAVVYDSTAVHAFDHQHQQYQFTVLPGGVQERFGLIYMPSQWEHRNGK